MKNLYISCRTNQGAGVGHQFAAWASAYSLAEMYGLTFAHQPLIKTHADWEPALQLGKGEVQFAELQAQGHPVAWLLKFDFPEAKDLLQEAINTAADGTVLHLQVDQFIPWILFSDKLPTKYPKPERIAPYVPYVAVHIRRGQMMEWTPEEREGRFLPNEYFAQVIQGIRRVVPDANVHVFSMGKLSEFPEFGHDVHMHLGRDEDDAPLEALHALICADILVMSRSGFSYMAGALADPRSVKIVHPYWMLTSDFSPNPEARCGVKPDPWIQCDINGNFNEAELTGRV